MWISTSQLEVGMIVDHDVKMNEIMLVKINTPLTDAHIRSLKRWNVSKVSIVQPEGMDLAPLAAENEEARRFSDQMFMKEKTRIDVLFRNVEQDSQMKMIKQCVLNRVEECYRGD